MKQEKVLVSRREGAEDAVLGEEEEIARRERKRSWQEGREGREEERKEEWRRGLSFPCPSVPWAPPLPLSTSIYSDLGSLSKNV